MLEKYSKGRKGEMVMGVLEGDLFKAMFENKDFAEDLDSEQFQYLNPIRRPARVGRNKEASDDSDEEYLEQTGELGTVMEGGEGRLREYA